MIHVFLFIMIRRYKLYRIRNFFVINIKKKNFISRLLMTLIYVTQILLGMNNLKIGTVS